MTSDDQREGAGDEQLGSVGEEAVKLLDALSDWARENGGGYAQAASALAADAASSLGSVNEHIATGGQDCRYCPLCQAIAAVRATSPEVRQHLSSAAGSLLQAVASAMATDVSARKPAQEGSRGPTAGRGDSPVEKIDLTDEPWDDA